MEYEVEIIINLPIAKATDLFDSFENMKNWQPGLVEAIPIKGTPGEQGAETKLIYDEKGRKVEMIEKIINRNFPKEFIATYDAKSVHNKCYNYFVEVDGQKTKWRMKNEFQFKGVMRVMSFFMRGAFPKQTLKDMNRFKNWAESI